MWSSGYEYGCCYITTTIFITITSTNSIPKFLLLASPCTNSFPSPSLLRVFPSQPFFLHCRWSIWRVWEPDCIRGAVITVCIGKLILLFYFYADIIVDPDLFCIISLHSHVYVRENFVCLLSKLLVWWVTLLRALPLMAVWVWTVYDATQSITANLVVHVHVYGTHFMVQNRSVHAITTILTLSVELDPAQ